MNRKEWKEQGTQSDDLVIVLRRRAKQLMRDDNFNEQYISVFLRAADELQARRYAAIPGGDEQLAVNAIADNRRLRNTLVKVFEQIRARKPHGWPDQVMTMAKNTLAAVRPYGEGRRIMAISIGNDQTREEIEASVAELLDAHFNGATDGKGEAEEPAGRDDAERAGQGDEEGTQQPEGEAAGAGSRSRDGSGSSSGTAD
jgi:hypothetical protein